MRVLLLMVLGAWSAAGCGDGASGGVGGVGGAGAGAGTGGTSGVGGATCQCEDVVVPGQVFNATMECFCRSFPCEPGSGPFGNGLIDTQTITEYGDCDRRLIEEFIENPSIWYLIDTTNDELVGSKYADDSGICGDGMVLRAGELANDGLAGCEITSMQVCDGPCETP